MSSITSSHDGSSKSTTLATTKDKMKVQQRMIDLTARELQSTRLSSQAIAESSPGNALEENILLVENKLMKLFSRQLMHKHIYIQEYMSQEKATNDNLLNIKEELDQLISLQMFLTVAGIEERTTKTLLASEEHLSVDTLFLMTPQELQQLFLRLNISSSDCHKLVSLLDLMSHYYEKWERGEKPTAEAYDIRRNSSSGRLNSLTSLDSRKDSSSSHTISPPAGNHCSRSSTPLTPGTPSSQTQSPFLGLPHQNSVPVLPTHMTNEHSFKRSNSSSGSGFTTLIDLPNQHLSSSSSSINSDHHEPVPPPPPTNNALRAKRKLGHTRSHSNPPLANLVLPEAVPEHSVVPDYRSPSPPYYNSTAPPTRTGSHSSIVQNNVNSPSAKSHPQVRRLMASNTSHVFTRSVSSDLGGEMNPEPPARSNSEASGVQSSSPRQRRLSKETGTSTSMVDLPLIRCNDQIDQNEYGFPQSGKSHSVPRLANLIVNVDNSAGQLHHSISVPTSPRLPSNYNPTGVIGHKIDHRFVNNLFFGVHECDYCKKTLVMNGSKCRYCKYKCHKNCAKLAPPTCGLPRDFLNYARRHKYLLMSPSNENVFQVQNNSNVTTPSTVTPPKSSLTNSGEYQSVINQAPPPSETKPDDNTFVIQDLNREPSNSQYSPVINARRHQLHPPPPPSPSHENGRVFGYQTSRLEVPQLHPSPLHTHHHYPHSTSSSPSTSTHSSPCLTPVSPRSPMEPLHMDYTPYTSGYSSVPVILTDDSETDDDYDSNQSDVSGESVENLDNISDQSHINGDGSHGLRPPPQVILAQSLPNLLLSDEQIHSATSSVLDSTGGMYATSEDNLQSWFNPRKDSLVATMSTADSKTSTLVGSIMEDDDASSFAESEHLGSQGGVDEEFRIKVGHRNSVVDEWIIPYDDLRLVERIGNGAIAEVFKGYWHGEVAVKRFLLPNATPNQIMKFKEEVAVLKKIRHENVALFMGVCLTPPNLAIITSLCRGYTLYKLLHYWSEVFSLERLVNVGRQIAQAMGYLHARGIIHKGLNAKNIFLEKTTDQKEKVVITDMGLSALSSSLWTSENETCLIRYPRTQLYYLPPEIMSLVTAYRETQLDHDIYPFNESTDIYAFGTILYELITRKYPFTTDALGFAYEYEVVVFLVGKGHRQQFKSTDIPKQLKDIVWECWDSKASNRPAFTELCERLARLCRKHTPITRSPSHPINLSKSVDNLLFI